MSNTPALAAPTVAARVLCTPTPTSSAPFGLEGLTAAVEIGDVERNEASTMAASPTLTHPAIDEITERFDSTACLDDRVRQAGRPIKPVARGCYIQIQGPNHMLLIPLANKVTHIGRGLAADLHLDDSSVSRRHALLVPLSRGYRILDDRSCNGTFVNGRRIEKADLHNGDVFVLGRVALRYLEYGPLPLADAPDHARKPAPHEEPVRAPHEGVEVFAVL